MKIIFSLITLICTTLLNNEYIDGRKTDNNNAVNNNATRCIPIEVLHNSMNRNKERPNGHATPIVHNNGQKKTGTNKVKCIFAGRQLIWDSLITAANKKVKRLLHTAKEQAQNYTRDLIGEVKKHSIRNAKRIFDVGGKLIQTPLRLAEFTVNKAWAVKNFGIGLTRQILSDTAGWFKMNWEAMKVIEFPGKNVLVMLFPERIVTMVVDKITKKAFYLINEVKSKLSSAVCYSIYKSLKVVNSAVMTVTRLTIGKCMQLFKIHEIPVNRNGIGTIYTHRGQICGLTNLKPSNKMTIKRNDKKFLVIVTPWIVEDINLKLNKLKVVSEYAAVGTLFENEDMTVTIKGIDATATVSFEAGTLFRFISIVIRVNHILGLKVRFDSEKKNTWMEAIEGMAEYFNDITKDEINRIFKKIEKAAYDFVVGKTKVAAGN